MATDKYPEHKALNPFFDVVMNGLKGLVDGEHYYDTIYEDAQFEFLYRFPGWPEVIRGRENLIAAYSGYGNNIELEQGDGLAVHHDKERGVVTLEYQIPGKAVKTGAVESKDCWLERSHGLSCRMAGAQRQMKFGTFRLTSFPTHHTREPDAPFLVFREIGTQSNR
jgi:hypothetical protein